jgi:hypothetical protein
MGGYLVKNCSTMKAVKAAAAVNCNATSRRKLARRDARAKRRPIAMVSAMRTA